MRMRGRLAAERVGFVHQRIQLCLRQLRRIHVIRQRKHPARGAGLDHIRAVFHVEADRGPHGFGAVGHAIFNSRFFEHARSKAGLVTVSAGRADRMNRHQHARPDDLAIANSVSQPDVDIAGRPHVADRGESGHQRLPCIFGGIQRTFRNGLSQAVEHVLLPVV
jgi:hypothetical protein